MTHKSRKNLRKFRSAGCSLLRAEGFFCNLEPRDREIVVFDIKKINFFSAVNIFQFLVIKIPGTVLDPYWIRIGIQPKMLDPDPYQMNTDLQPWLYLFIIVYVFMFFQILLVTCYLSR